MIGCTFCRTTGVTGVAVDECLREEDRRDGRRAGADHGGGEDVPPAEPQERRQRRDEERQRDGDEHEVLAEHDRRHLRRTREGNADPRIEPPERRRDGDQDRPCRPLHVSETSHARGQCRHALEPRGEPGPSLDRLVPAHQLVDLVVVVGVLVGRVLQERIRRDVGHAELSEEVIPTRRAALRTRRGSARAARRRVRAARRRRRRGRGSRVGASRHGRTTPRKISTSARSRAGPPARARARFAGRSRASRRRSRRRARRPARPSGRSRRRRVCGRTRRRRPTRRRARPDPLRARRARSWSSTECARRAISRSGQAPRAAARRPRSARPAV